MQKKIGILSLICFIVTTLWLILLIAGMASAEKMETFEQVLTYLNNAGIIFYAGYTNAALITVIAVMLFIALFIYLKPFSSDWSTIGVSFIPIYGSINLIVYLSQITIVPRLLELSSNPEYKSFSQFLLQQSVQIWPNSAAFIMNNLAYAVLGIPSIIFGIIMIKAILGLRVSGILLALSGIASIVGFFGISVRNIIFSQGSLVGGVLFLFALAVMSWTFLFSELSKN